MSCGYSEAVWGVSLYPVMDFTQFFFFSKDWIFSLYPPGSGPTFTSLERKQLKVLLMVV